MRNTPSELTWRYDEDASRYRWQVFDKHDERQIPIAGVTTAELGCYLRGKKLDTRRQKVFEQLNRDRELSEALLKQKLKE